MDHFPAGDWIDLARGLVEESKAAPMRAHLDRACRDCVQSSETWQLISELFAREAAYRPPDGAVRTVKAAYVPETRVKWLPEIAQFAQLIFDSFRQSATAMVRSAMQASRQLVHEAAPFTIDVRMERDARRNRVYLAGQILNSQSPEKVPAAVDVVLLSGERLLKRTLANASGEFDLDFDSEANLQLFINIRGERAIGIVLPDPDS